LFFCRPFYFNERLEHVAALLLFDSEEMREREKEHVAALLLFDSEEMREREKTTKGKI